MKESKKTADSALKWGLFSALLASLCCIGPLVLILFGIGGASTALSIGYRKPYFLIFGLLVLAIGFFLIYRKNCQRKKFNGKRQFLIFGGSFIVAVLSYYLLTYIVAPLLAPLIYSFRFGA
jgi:mercuric ion transport protein